MIPYGTEEWKRARVGRVTASRIADLTARTKTGYGASRDNYMAELIAERLTGVAAEGYTNAAMQWGVDYEPEARRTYEFYADTTTTEGGFILHPSIPQSGASPDAFVGDVGLIEIKCPNTATHLDTLLEGDVPAKYLKQMQWQMRCAERTWCDFVSFDPRLPERMRLFVKRVTRDDALCDALEKEVVAFLAELDGKIEALRKRYER